MDRVSRVLTIIITVLLSTMLFMWVGPAAETRFFPVYSKFTVVEAIEVEGGTMARFRFTKYRECYARGWAWFIGDFGAISRQVEVRPIDEPIIRPLGDAVSNPYFIAATPDQVRDQMHAEIFSRCHLLWLTRSVVYP
jgi:hypothetical protein